MDAQAADAFYRRVGPHAPAQQGDLMLFSFALWPAGPQPAGHVNLARAYAPRQWVREHAEPAKNEPVGPG